MRARALGFLALTGLWFLSQTLFVLGLCGLLAAFGVWVVTRFVRTRAVLAASSAGVLVVAFVLVKALLAMVPPPESDLAHARDDGAMVSATAVPYATSSSSDIGARSAGRGSFDDTLDIGGVVVGATPVAVLVRSGSGSGSGSGSRSRSRSRSRAICGALVRHVWRDLAAMGVAAASGSL